MTKVLLLQGSIPSYRVPIFNLLAKQVDLTVVYSYGEEPQNAEFKFVKVPVVRLHYKIHKKNIIKMARQYDVVICMLDYSYLYFRLLNKIPRKFKLIFWGIGVSASYEQRYDEDQTNVNFMLKLIKNSDATVFYSDYPKEKYSKLGADKNKMFVANNTVKVDTELPDRTYDKVIFIGSLYKQKRIDILIDEYKKAYDRNKDIPGLLIIGDGDQKQIIEKMVKDYGLGEKVELLGSITDDKILKGYFTQSIACISPDQAGLSVLKSMGYGVPFITFKNAITGGEIFNIKDGQNGVLLNSLEDISNVLYDITVNKEKYIKYGESAYAFYWENRKPEQMVSGFIDSVNYVLNTKEDTI